MLLTVLFGSAGISADHRTGQSGPLQEIFIGERIPVAERSARIPRIVLYQCAIGRVCVIIRAGFYIVPGAVDEQVVDPERDGRLRLGEIHSL